MPTVARGLYRWIVQRGATLEDFADRLNHFWTFALLLVFGAIISWKQGYSDPMVCWVPAQFTDAMVQYTQSHCWHSHYIKYMSDIMEAEEMLNISSYPLWWRLRSESRWPTVSYDYPFEASLLTEYSTTTTLYQWLPLILVFSALLFKLPNLVLYCCHGYSGLSFDKLNGLTEGHGRLNIADRAIVSRQISRYIYNWCNQGCNVLPWRFLSLAWLLTKAFYLTNIVTQMFFLNRYLRTTNPPFDNSSSYGDVIRDNLFSNNGSMWRRSPVFPRHVLCDFTIRQIANLHRYTVQCDLPMNEYSEVAFIVIWVWYLFVAIVSSLSFTVWLVQVAVPVFRQRYIYKMLRLSEEFSHVTSNDTDRFADWIGEDGVMALKLIGSNSSDLVVSDVICNMWRRRQVQTGTSKHQHPVYPDTSQTAHAQVPPESVPLQPVYQTDYPGTSQTAHAQVPPESGPLQPLYQTNYPGTSQTAHAQVPPESVPMMHDQSSTPLLYPNVIME